MCDEKYIELAIREAAKSPMSHKYGAVLISKKGEILNVGYNRYCGYNQSRLKEKSSTYHAEMNACKKVPKRKIRGATLVVVRLDKEKVINCESCDVCKKMICNYGISKVYLSRE